MHAKHSVLSATIISWLLSQVFGNFLFHAHSISAHHCNGGALPRTHYLSTIANVAGPTADFLLGEFRLPDGRIAMFVHNQDTEHTTYASMSFRNCSLSSVTEVDRQTGAENIVEDDSPRLPGLTLAIEAGAGRLLVVPS